MSTTIMMPTHKPALNIPPIISHPGNNKTDVKRIRITDIYLLFNKKLYILSQQYNF